MRLFFSLLFLIGLAALTGCRSLFMAERLPEMAEVAVTPEPVLTETVVQLQPAPTATPIPALPTTAPVETPTATATFTPTPARRCGS